MDDLSAEDLPRLSEEVNDLQQQFDEVAIQKHNLNAKIKEYSEKFKNLTNLLDRSVFLVLSSLSCFHFCTEQTIYYLLLCYHLIVNPFLNLNFYFNFVLVSLFEFLAYIVNHRVTKTPQTYKPGLEEGFGQTTRKVLCVRAPVPFSRESRNQFMNNRLKTMASPVAEIEGGQGGGCPPHSESKEVCRKICRKFYCLEEIVGKL